MNSTQIIKDIKNLKIQGAENIAKVSLQLLKSESKRHDINKLKSISLKLINTRPTEPCLRNSIKYVFYESSEASDVLRKCNLALNHFAFADDKISEIGAKKISNNMVIFTHCHSSTVIEILKRAKSQGKRFKVFCTETRPRLQGRKTAKELIDAGIDVTLFVDSGMRIALKGSDLCLIGSDAITTEGKVINKIGSEVVAMICDSFDIPLYSCTNSWKFDPKTIFGYEEEIERRSDKEIWQKPPKGLKISNYAFEKVKPDYVSGIISEIGIYKPCVFVEELRHHYPWLYE